MVVVFRVGLETPVDSMPPQHLVFPQQGESEQERNLDQIPRPDSYMYLGTWYRYIHVHLPLQQPQMPVFSTNSLLYVHVSNTFYSYRGRHLTCMYVPVDDRRAFADTLYTGTSSRASTPTMPRLSPGIR